MYLLLGVSAVWLVTLIAHDKRVEKICWFALFLSFAAHINLFYIHYYPHYIGRQNGGISVTITDIITLGLLLRYLLRKRKKNRLPFNPNFRYGIYFLFCLCSIIYSYNVSMSINELGTIFELLLLGILITRYFKPQYFRYFVSALVINIYIQALLCVIQLRTGIDFRSTEMLTQRYGVYRCMGIYISAGELSLIAIVSAFVLIGVLLNNGSALTSTKKKLIEGAIAASVFCLIAGQSRVGFVIFGMGLILLALMKNSNMNSNAKILLRIIVTLGLLGILIMSVLGEIDVGNSYDMAYSRFLMWAMATQVFVNNPILGVGINAYTAYNSVFSTSSIYWERTNPVHNIFLMELAETGIIGFVLLYLFYYFPILTYAYRNKNKSVYALILFIVLFVQLVYGFTGWVFYSPSLRFLNFGTFMILLIMTSKDRESVEKEW